MTNCPHYQEHYPSAFPRCEKTGRICHSNVNADYLNCKVYLKNNTCLSEGACKVCKTALCPDNENPSFHKEQKTTGEKECDGMEWDDSDYP